MGYRRLVEQHADVLAALGAADKLPALEPGADGAARPVARRFLTGRGDERCCLDDCPGAPDVVVAVSRR